MIFSWIDQLGVAKVILRLPPYTDSDAVTPEFSLPVDFQAAPGNKKQVERSRHTEQCDPGGYN
jgi:hypothetical protein